eukprot:TRINITY_DN6292_c0_g1_i2.p1 TRINITY_DN6292_c0_g1~~TRINITY_DN6292_c0_g1_i2.p1  ORF type:complete len:443 (-),score=133.02 TRINITY_DN6292_c0_g1_i2:69-1199(-)
MKNILAKRIEELDQELHHLVQNETVAIDYIRQHLNRARTKRLKEICSGANYKACQHYVNEADPEFGITPLHLAYADGDLAAISFLTSLGANKDLFDTAGRKPLNLSFTNFVANSKKWAKMAGRNDCDLPTITIRSKEDFSEVRRLVNEGEPFLLRNALPHLEHGRDLLPFNVDAIVRKNSKSHVTVGEVPYAKVFALPHHVSNLGDYYEHHILKKAEFPLYIFEKNSNITEIVVPVFEELVNSYFPSPELICPLSYGGVESLHYFLGTRNSGAPFHIHSDAINLLLAGKKQWMIHPPITSVYSRKSVSRWIQDENSRKSHESLECVQNSGDFVYLPFDWSHAVLNLEDENFGYALEILNRRTTLLSLPSRYLSCQK